MTEPNGPTVYLPGDVRENSRDLGLPVVNDDGFTHSTQCYWCDGEADNDTCRRSIQLREYVERLRIND